MPLILGPKALAREAENNLFGMIKIVTTRKKEKYRWLNIFRVTNDKAVLLKFKAARNKFRAIFNRKREQCFKLEKDNLVNSVDDAKQFWKTLKRNISNSHFSGSDISPGQWYQHHDSLLNAKGVDSSVNKEFENSVDLFLKIMTKTVISVTDRSRKPYFI